MLILAPTLISRKTLKYWNVEYINSHLKTEINGKIHDNENEHRHQYDLRLFRNFTSYISVLFLWKSQQVLSSCINDKQHFIMYQILFKWIFQFFTLVSKYKRTMEKRISYCLWLTNYFVLCFRKKFCFLRLPSILYGEVKETILLNKRIYRKSCTTYFWFS